MSTSWLLVATLLTGDGFEVNTRQFGTLEECSLRVAIMKHSTIVTMAECFPTETDDG